MLCCGDSDTAGNIARFHRLVKRRVRFQSHCGGSWRFWGAVINEEKIAYQWRQAMINRVVLVWWLVKAGSGGVAHLDAWKAIVITILIKN